MQFASIAHTSEAREGSVCLSVFQSVKGLRLTKVCIIGNDNNTKQRKMYAKLDRL